MPIRQRSHKTIEDHHIRAALQSGLVAVRRIHQSKIEFGETNDAELMRLDERIAYYERMLKLDGNFSIAIED